MERNKPLQEGVRVKLPEGMTWEKLAVFWFGHSFSSESASLFCWNGGIRGFLRRSFEISSRAVGHPGIVAAGAVASAIAQILAEGRPASIREIARAINGR